MEIKFKFKDIEDLENQVSSFLKGVKKIKAKEDTIKKINKVVVLETIIKTLLSLMEESNLQVLGIYGNNDFKCKIIDSFGNEIRMADESSRYLWSSCYREVGDKEKYMERR